MIELIRFILETVGAVVFLWIFFDRLDFWLTYRNIHKKK